MEGYGLDDRVLLYLAGNDDGEVSCGDSVSGIGNAVASDTAVMSEWISLFSTLTALDDENLVSKYTDGSPVDHEANVYQLTDAGRERVATVRKRLEDETIRVVDGDSEETVDVGTILERTAGDDHLSVLTKLTEDGVLYRRERPSSAPEETIVGRDSTVAQLGAAMDRAADGNGRAMFLRSEPGVGKTALLERAVEMATDREFVVGQTSCQPLTRTPYHSVKSLVDEVVQTDSTPFDHLQDPTEEPTAFEAERNALFTDVAEAVVDSGGDRPVLLAVDDLHRCDEPTRALLSFLVEQFRDEHILFLGTYRPDTEGDLPLDVSVAETDQLTTLEPLDADGTERLIEATLGVTAVPETLVEQVYDQTGGTPLFVIATIQHLVDEGRLDPDYGVFPDVDETVPVPDEVEATLETQLTTMDDRFRTLLERGAILGESFSVSSLLRSASGDRSELLDKLDILVELGLLKRSDDGDSVRFPSSFMREYIYDALDEETKRELHGEVATALAATTVDEPGGFHRIATHYEAANRPETALEYYQQAGTHARNEYAHELAIEAYERAVTLARDLDGVAVATLIEELGDVNTTIANYDEAARHFKYVLQGADDGETSRRMYRKLSNVATQTSDHDQAIEYANAGLAIDDGSTTPERCRLLSKKGAAHSLKDNLDTAAEIFQRELDRAADHGERELARALTDVGKIQWKRGELSEAGTTLAEAVDRWETIEDDDTELAGALNTLGIVKNIQGKYEQSVDCWERAISLYRSVGHESGLAGALTNMGSVYYYRGQWDTALDCWEEAAETFQRIGNDVNTAVCLGNLANVHQSRCELDVAHARAEESLNFQSAADGNVFGLHMLGWIRYHQGRLDDATDIVQRATQYVTDKNSRFVSNKMLESSIDKQRGNFEDVIDNCTELLDTEIVAEDPSMRTSVHGLLAEAYNETGVASQAREHADTALETADESGAIPDRTTALEAAGRVHYTQDRYERARDDLTAALRLSEDVRSRSAEIQSRLFLGRVEAATENHERARDHLDRAVTLCERYGVELYLDQCREALASLPPADAG